MKTPRMPVLLLCLCVLQLAACGGGAGEDAPTGDEVRQVPPPVSCSSRPEACR